MAVSPDYLDVLVFKDGYELNIPDYEPKAKISGGMLPGFPDLSNEI